MTQTAKKKAEELVSKFMPHSNGNSNENEAKKCAIICVDEILNNFGLQCNGKHYCDYATIQYYERVKTEIEAL